MAKYDSRRFNTAYTELENFKNNPPCTAPRLYYRHTRLFLPVAHLPLLLPGLQTQRLAEGTHQVSPRDQRRQLQLLTLQLHLHLPLAAGEAHEPPQGYQGAGKTRARRCQLGLRVAHECLINSTMHQTEGNIRSAIVVTCVTVTFNYNINYCRLEAQNVLTY